MGVELINPELLINGYGDSCIIALTQILDKYLIQQNFIFNKPIFKLKTQKEIKLSFKFDDDYFNDKISFSDETTKVSLQIINNQSNEKFKTKEKISFNENNWLRELISVNDTLEEAASLIFKTNTKTNKIKEIDISSNMKNALDEYFGLQEEKIKTLQLKESLIINKDNTILNKFSRSLPKLTSFQKEENSLTNHITVKTLELDQLKEKLMILDNKYNNKVTNVKSNSSGKLMKNINSIKNEFFKYDQKQAIISNYIIKSTQKSSLIKNEYIVYEKNKHTDYDFDEVV